MRKSKKLLRSIIEDISNGATVTGVCKKNGISRTTFYRWLKEDVNFAKDFKNAEKMKEYLKNDIADKEHMKNMNQGYWPAIKYQLDKKNFAERKLAEKEFQIKTNEILETERTESIRKFHEIFYGDLRLAEEVLENCERRHDAIRKKVESDYEDDIRKEIEKEKIEKLRNQDKENEEDESDDEN